MLIWMEMIGWNYIEDEGIMIETTWVNFVYIPTWICSSGWCILCLDHNRDRIGWSGAFQRWVGYFWIGSFFTMWPTWPNQKMPILSTGSGKRLKRDRSCRNNSHKPTITCLCRISPKSIWCYWIQKSIELLNWVVGLKHVCS